ncbi:MAG: SRPBCC family protein [Prevotellaceae bacterium]|nr:SRPBCC family protein [Prevotellaceae bacterium]
MTKYESGVKHLAYPIESVYARLSDMTSLETLRERMNDPTLRERLTAQAQGKVTPEQLERTASLVEGMRLTRDTVTTEVPPVGTVTLRVVERQEPKLVKCETEGSPIAGCLWIQLLPEGERGCAMKLTLGAELNLILRQMLKAKIQDGVERLADTLAALPY